MDTLRPLVIQGLQSCFTFRLESAFRGAYLLTICIDDLLPIVIKKSRKPFIQFSFSARFHEECSVFSSVEETVPRFSNFRAVSNLKFVSKVIGKAATIRLANYLCDNNLNESLQST